MTNSYSAKVLAVRIVTQSRGSRTPGTDGILWLCSYQKMEAALNLTHKRYVSQPLKRIYIPKPGKDTKRPLSIPTLYDRAMQALFALALQPVAETSADKRSFGFRLFRSAQDASKYAFICLCHTKSAPWILEGDIKGCFDNISHQWLKDNIPIKRSILCQFLKSGYLYDGKLYHQDKGTPQGGVVSPILANMTLDGIEELLNQQYPNMKVHLIRYADDFLVTAPDKEVAEEIRELIQIFLAERGLELSEAKTTITHIDEGFDFLGWNFRKYDGQLLIKPSKNSIKNIIDKVRKIIHKSSAWTQERLINTLNPIITGWVNYHRHVVAKATFSKLDYLLWEMLWHWAKRRHHNKGHRWIARRYWHTEGLRNWVFKSGKVKLVLFADTKIRRHVMVKLDKNPYLDRDYFLERTNRIKKQTPWIQSKLSYFAYRRPKYGL